MKHTIRILLLLTVLVMLLAATGLADLQWPQVSTEGQRQLQQYTERVNEQLAKLGIPQINSVFECYSGFVEMGITAYPNSEVPEDVEISFTLTGQSVQDVVIRTSRSDYFPALCAAFLLTLTPDELTAEEALKAPKTYMNRFLRNPESSYEETVMPGNGDTPRTYYSYYYNQYQDNVNWYQLTLVFPAGGLIHKAGTTVTPLPDGVTPVPGDNGNTFGGFGYDGGVHFEVFVTPTPEPELMY